MAFSNSSAGFLHPANSSVFICCEKSNYGTSVANVVGYVCVFSLLSLFGLAFNLGLLIILRRECLIHIPTYFGLMLLSISNLLIALLIAPLTVLQHIRPAGWIGSIPDNVHNCITGTVLFWKVFLLVKLALYRMRITGRETVDETKIRTCITSGIFTLLLAFLLALQHLFAFNAATAEFLFVPDVIIFILSLLVVISSSTVVWLKSNGGRFRTVRHGRFFQNEIGQKTEWRLNKFLIIFSAGEFTMVAATIFQKMISSTAPNQSISGFGLRCGNQEVILWWLRKVPMMFACLSALWMPVLTHFRSDIVGDYNGWSRWWRKRKREEVPLGKSSTNIRCIAYRNDDFSENR